MWKKEQNIDNKQYLEDRDEVFEREGLLPAIKIEDFYISNTGDPSNLYYIDENGSYWICGAGVGGKEKILPNYYEVVDYIMIYTHEFVPYDEMIN